MCTYKLAFMNGCKWQIGCVWDDEDAYGSASVASVATAVVWIGAKKLND